MPKRVSDYYYIFDGRSGRPVIVDRDSGAPARRTAPDVQPDCMPVARHVLQRFGAGTLRTFACWCAQHTWPAASPPDACAVLWNAARRVACGNAPAPETLTAARSHSNDDAVMAAAVGMPHRRPRAAQLLAARACTEPDVLHAAHDAMHMSMRWAEFTHETDDAADAAIRTMHATHLNALLDALNHDAPFQRPDFLDRA